jgi:ABC-type dipeptide/oligopeptide/nickel transport system permease subunit
MLIGRMGAERLRRSKSARVGAGLVGALVVLATIGPAIASSDATTPDFDGGRAPFGSPLAPCARHWFGTDTMFRDVLARIATGGRLSLAVALGGTGIALAIGTIAGVVAAFAGDRRVKLERLLGVGVVTFALASALRRWIDDGTYVALIVTSIALAVARRIRARSLSTGADDVAAIALGAVALAAHARGASARWILPIGFGGLFFSEIVSWRRDDAFADRVSVRVDDLLMRAVDALLAFPYLLLLMAVAAAVDSTSPLTILLVLGLTSWTTIARVVRAKALQIVALDFVAAGRALGQSPMRIVTRHVLPNLVGPLLVLMSNSIAAMIVAEAALAFLGLSVPPPAPSWGRMLDEGRPYFSAAPWLVAAPGGAILIAVLGFNLLGEGLRDALDPKAS